MYYENYHDYMTEDPRATLMYNEGYRVMADPVEYPPPTQNHTNNTHNLQSMGRPHSIGCFMTQQWYRSVLNDRFTVGNLRNICKALDIRASYSSSKKSLIVDILINYLNELVIRGQAAEYNRAIDICNQNKRTYGCPLVIPFRRFESFLDGNAFVKLTEMIFDGQPEFPVLKPVKISKRLTPLICLDFCTSSSDSYFELEFNYKPPANYFNYYNSATNNNNINNNKNQKPVRAFLLVYRLKERRAIEAFETYKAVNEAAIYEQITPSIDQMIKFSGIPTDLVDRVRACYNSNLTGGMSSPNGRRPPLNQHPNLLPAPYSSKMTPNELIEAKITDALKDPIFLEMFVNKFKNQQASSNNLSGDSSKTGMEEIERRIFEVLKKVDPAPIAFSTSGLTNVTTHSAPDLQQNTTNTTPLAVNSNAKSTSYTISSPPSEGIISSSPQSHYDSSDSILSPNFYDLLKTLDPNSLDILHFSIDTLPSPPNSNVSTSKEKILNSAIGDKSNLKFVSIPAQKIKLTSTDFKLTMAKRLRFNLNNDKLYILGTGRSSVCPINQHQFTKDGTRNRLIIEGAKYGDQHYFVQIVEGEIDEAAFLKEISFPVIQADIVRKNFFKRDKNESEIESLEIVLPLKCPITMTRLVVPIRGSACHHLNCYNLDSIKSFISGKKFFKCSICSKELSAGNLVIDGYVQDIINRTKPDDEEVVIDSKTGVWNVRDSPARMVDSENEYQERKITERSTKIARTDGPLEPLTVSDIINGNRVMKGPPGSSIVNAIVLD